MMAPRNSVHARYCSWVDEKVRTTVKTGLHAPLLRVAGETLFHLRDYKYQP